MPRKKKNARNEKKRPLVLVVVRPAVRHWAEILHSGCDGLLLRLHVENR